MDKKNTLQDRFNISKIWKTVWSIITSAALIAALGNKSVAQTTLSPELSKKWETLHIWEDWHQEDIFHCFADQHNHDHSDTERYQDNLSIRGGPLYKDCDTVRLYDLVVDNKTRVDGFKYNSTIGSVYAQEWINLKTMGISTMPITNDIATWITSRPNIEWVLQDVWEYIINKENTIPQELKDTLNYVIANYSPDIITITVPDGMWWAGGVASVPRRDAQSQTRAYNAGPQVTIVRNFWYDQDQKESSYYKIKAHEIWHAWFGKHHTDENFDEMSGRAADPTFRWYMASINNWSTTREDTDMNKHIAATSSPFLLKVNQARECSLSITHPDKNEATILTYPNPTPSELIIEDKDNYILWDKVSIIDMMGRKIEVKIKDNKVDLSSLPSGSFYIQLPLKTWAIKVANIIKI